jgi:hypothetical protein
VSIKAQKNSHARALTPTWLFSFSLEDSRLYVLVSEIPKSNHLNAVGSENEQYP